MKKAGASARSRRASSPLSSPIPVTGRSSGPQHTTPVRLLPRQVALVVSRLVRQPPCIRFLVLVLSPAQEFVVASVVLILLGSCLVRRITTTVPPSHR